MNCSGWIIKPLMVGGVQQGWTSVTATVVVADGEQECRECCGEPVLEFINGNELPEVHCGDGCKKNFRPLAGSTDGEIEVWCCRR